MLCERCQAFDVQTFSKTKFPFRGYRVEAVRAAKNGCSFCALLEEHLLQRRQKMSSHQALATIRRTLGKVGLPSWIHFWVERGDTADINVLDIRVIRASVSISPLLLPKSRGAIKVHVEADPETPAASSGDITGHLLGRHMLSANVEKFILEWHQHCRENHPDCSKTLSQFESVDPEVAPLPSRCVETVWIPALEVDSPGLSGSSTGAGSSGGHWAHYLRETSGEISKYVALSHRWDASTEKARTFRANYLSRVTPGDDSSLNDEDAMSPLFRDVCVFAARLGIFLVWIDSICIVQDDLDDWRHEAVRMAGYYQSAWLTVAITSPSDKGGGLHAYPRAEDIPRVARLPYRAKDGAHRGWFYAQCVSRDALNTEYDARVARSELLTRGWVFQEWLLSRRILSLGATTIFLQCEGGPPASPPGETLKSRYKSDDADDSERRVSFKRDMSLKHAGVAKILELWRRVVEDYSGKRLTKYEQDRLVALSGVAREFGLALQIQSQDRRYGYDLPIYNSSYSPPEAAATRNSTYTGGQLARSNSQHRDSDIGEDIELQNFDSEADGERGEQAWTTSMSIQGNDAAESSVRSRHRPLPYQHGADEELEPLVPAGQSLLAEQNDSTTPHSQNTPTCTDKPVRYVCGLWLPFSILSQLQWEQVSPGPRSRARGTPTWSWASIGKQTGEHASSRLDPVPVTWPDGAFDNDHPNDRYRSDDQGSVKVDIATSVPVDEISWKPRFDLASVDDRTDNDEATDSRFIILKITNTALLPVHIDAIFESEEHIGVAAGLTGHRTDKIDRSGWRRVSLSTTPNTIVGWASLEHPDFQTNEQVQSGSSGSDNTSVYALLLDEVKVWWSLGDPMVLAPRDGLRRYLSFLGFGTRSVSTCRVLFVRGAADRDRSQQLELYERVGVGRLFGPMVKSDFGRLEKKTVFLR
ncbi:heterokaryon incompatibility protein-domain-containing protein [Hypoxylon rubiginosum]|uniref:Heterokaryon incompatibility protein-domain-containing protein n=1 Tax=Hypoxylon rubiginosum TaxID=110542 RepID=A0ACC0D0V6_9PEZI|nr:heterokaryon incompatibility protein-domain-containing protein [Hypoxylon rubiginosum]